jgi:uncharacterized membrane protein
MAKSKSLSKSNYLHQTVLTALFIALVTIATMIIKVPTIATQGFINVGDAMVFIGAMLGGPKRGMIAGGIGSALADILSGYAAWAPWTLVIKAIEGLIVGLFASTNYREKNKFGFVEIAVLIVSALWMVFGYYVAGGIMKGFAVSVMEIPANFIQASGSLIIAIPVLLALRKTTLNI